MNKRIKSGILAFLILFSSVISSIPSFAETPKDYTDTEIGNQAQTLISNIDLYLPKEVMDLEVGEIVDGEEGTAQVTLDVFSRYARYLYYVEQLAELETKYNTQTTDIVKDSLEYYQKTTNNIAPKFNGMKTSEEVLKFVMEDAEKSMTAIVEQVMNSSSDGVREYKDNFELVKRNMKAWSDSIRFLRDEVGVDDVEYKKITDNFNAVYDKVSQANRELGLDMDLGLIRPESTYDEMATISNNMFGEDGMAQWYMEIIAISAHLDGQHLDELTYKMSKVAKEQYDKLKAYRVPLRAGNDNEPIKALNDNRPVGTTMSNLQRFIEGRDSEQVLYVPVQTGLDKREVTTTTQTEETVTEDGTVVTDVTELPPEDNNVEVEENMSSKNVSIEPVYIKGDQTPKLGKKQSDFELGGEEDRRTDRYSTALMNHLQFTNYYQSGKLNDMQQDMAYPLFMDVFGNIQTYSGKVIIPAVANMSLMKGDEYFPLNAFFINNYPSETSGREIDNLLKPDPKKYIVKMEEVSTVGGETEKEETNPEVAKADSYLYKMAKYQKKGFLSSEYKVGVGERFKSGFHELPRIVPYIENQNGDKTMFMDIVEMGNSSIFGKLSKYYILGLKEQAVLSQDGTPIPFKFINEQVPVENWNMMYNWGEDGDKGNYDNQRLAIIAESAYSSNIDYDILKENDNYRKTMGSKVGAMVEPIHKTMSEATRNYILYTPSIAELPMVGEFLSVILIPLIKIIVIVMAVVAIFKYLRNVHEMSIKNLAFALAVLIFSNTAITTIYPLILNGVFNGSVSRIFGKHAYHLTLYNVEKDLNSRGEFIYGDKPSKITSDGAYIKLADIDITEVSRFRAAEEDAPWKESDFYMAKWDTNPVNVSRNTFIKGDTLNVYVKDLFASCKVGYTGSDYELTWNMYPDYSYYTPYLAVMEGLTYSLNSYTSGRFSPKIIKYTTGHEGESGGALAYFNSKYFLVDNGSARDSAKGDPEFYQEWVKYNGGDFLNLRSLLYTDNELSKFSMTDAFPPTVDSEGTVIYNPEFAMKSSRWFRTANNHRTPRVIEQKILDVNLRTKEYIFKLLPYMDNITDDVALKMIALNAVENFSKEFSHTPFEKARILPDFLLGKFNRQAPRDYWTDVYPKRLELDNISIDEHLKITLINVRDLLKFNVTSLYKYVENQSHWLGMLMLSTITLLLYIRSILRVFFIGVVLVVVLFYMVIVYAFQRDYTNKTIYGMLGIVGHSWGVYAIDNLLTVGFATIDKSSAGIMLLILLVWMMWNVVATFIYVQLFILIFKEIKSFGGEVFYDNLTKFLNMATNVGQSLIRPISETTADNFDLTRPDLELEVEEFREYLGMDLEPKFRMIGQEGLGKSNKLSRDAMKFGQDKFSEMKGENIREAYNRQKDNENLIIDMSPGFTREASKDLLSAYGMNVSTDFNSGDITLTGASEDLGKLIKDHEIKTDNFDGLYKEHGNSLYFPKTKMNEEFLSRAGISFRDNQYALQVSRTLLPKVGEMMEAVKTPLIRVGTDKFDALDILDENLINPTEYTVGSNGVYFTEDKTDLASELFGSNISKTYKTMHPLLDYQDKLPDGGKINDSIQLINGMMVTNEYVYGGMSNTLKDALVAKELKLTTMGNQVYKFNLDQKNDVVDVIKGTVRYTENQDSGILFRDQTEVDRMFTVGDDGYNHTEDNRTRHIDSDDKPTPPRDNTKLEDSSHKLIENDIDDMDLGI